MLTLFRPSVKTAQGNVDCTSNQMHCQLNLKTDIDKFTKSITWGHHLCIIYVQFSGRSFLQNKVSGKAYLSGRFRR